jgi:hypothetical protein
MRCQSLYYSAFGVGQWEDDNEGCGIDGVRSGF